MSELFQIYIKPKAGVTRESIEKCMNLAVDWFRVSNNVYIVYTTSDSKKWNVRLAPFVRPGGYCLITVLVPDDYSGWMPRRFWDWFREKKEKLGY